MGYRLIGFSVEDDGCTLTCDYVDSRGATHTKGRTWASPEQARTERPAFIAALLKSIRIGRHAIL